MAVYGLPDLTGVDPEYLQVNIPFVIYKVGMKISFENSPIYASSLVITMTDGTGRILEKDVDWTVNPDDEDQTAMSRAKLSYIDFSSVLVKSVTILSNVALNSRVAMTFQEFYPTIPGRTYDDGTPLELTPDLIKNLQTGINSANQQLARVNSPVAQTIAAPKLLPFDINGELSSNIITDEPVIVNTVAGAKVIRLSQGAFFANSLQIKYNGNVLSSTTDYMPVVISPLTDKSTNVGGIYNYILLNGSFSGNLSVTYRAVGGEVQIEDINSIYNLMISIKTFLDDGVFITSETVTQTPAFRSFNSRINLLEDGMRRLLSGVPTYGDSSSGTAVTRPISTTDADLHWWTIATLYTVQGSTDIIRADRFKGRVYLPGSKISLTFTVDVNMDQERNPVSFHTESVVFDPTYTLFNDLSVAAPQYPLIRVVWNNAAESFSGACIQIGVPLPNLTDQMIVEDMSTSESCWILTRTGEFIPGETTLYSAPQDNGFILPDDASVWSDVSAISFNSVHVPEYKNGYLLHSGSSISVNDLVTLSSTDSLFTKVLPSYFPVDEVKSIVLTMTSNDTDTVYDVVVPVSSITEGTVTGQILFADSELETMIMTVKLVKTPINTITFDANITEVANPLTGGSVSSKTDLVRYVRVRV